jgi:predicted ATPase/transcriptional regulator with XRE-family HTH domain
LLRHHRLACGFSQEYLAEQAGVSVNAIWAWESGARRAPYRENVEALVAALTLSQEEAVQLRASANRARTRTRKSATQVAPPDTGDREASYLPTLRTVFFGRNEDLVRVENLLIAENPPMVTIAGPGGVGKTRFAIEVARKVAAHFSDGVYFVDLAGIIEPQYVPHAVAKAVGVVEADDQNVEQALRYRLGGRHLLLLVDNCEHVLEAVSKMLAELLLEHPTVAVLATSREATRLSAEILYILDPLAYPTENIAVDAVDRYPALQLFVDRAARAIADGFALSEESVAGASEVVRRLDGLPLAIELAIPMLRVLSVQQLVDNLNDRFGLLTAGYRDAPDRHRTLTGVIAWSYDSLNDIERFVFESCSIFPESFNTDAVVAICESEKVRPGAIVTAILRLIEKSLLVAVPSSAGRYRLLETLREYSRVKARESGISDTLLPKVARHFRNVANVISSTKSVSYIDRDRPLGPDIATIELIVTWALFEANDPRLGAELILKINNAIYRFVGKRSREWYKCAVRVLDPELDEELFAKAVLGLEEKSETAADVEERLPNVERAMDIFQRADNSIKLLQCKVYYAYDLISIGEFDRAQASGDESVRLARKCGRPGVLAWALRSRARLLLDRDPARQRLLAIEALDLLRGNEIEGEGYTKTLSRLGEAEFFAGDLEAALTHTRAACAASVEDGTAFGPDWAILLCNITAITLALEDAQGAFLAGRRALQACMDAHEAILVLFTMHHIGFAAALRGDLRGAATIAGYCEPWLPKMTKPQFRLFSHVSDLFREFLGARLDARELQRILQSGAALSQDGAMELALRL